MMHAFDLTPLDELVYRQREAPVSLCLGWQSDLIAASWRRIPYDPHLVTHPRQSNLW